MRYMVPFDAVKKCLNIKPNGNSEITMSYERLQEALRMILRVVPVDEDWYKQTYPDVAEAIRKGIVTSAKQHFIADGYFEGRRPFEHEVDEEWYVNAYPDVKEGVEGGEIASVREHFVTHGYREGRFPGNS